jgi:hypothetical protein
MIRLFYLFLSMLVLTSCTEDHAGGPGSETTNGIYAQVLLADGSVAANMGVALRKTNFVPDSASPTEKMAIPDTYTDSLGLLRIDSAPPGDYRLTLLNTTEAFSTHITVSDTENVNLGEIKLSLPGAIQGQISLPQGTSYSWVGVYGLDVLVKTDSLGVFTMPSLPAGDVQLFFYSPHYTEVVADTQVTVISGSTVSWKIANPSMLLESFEDTASFRDWYYVSDTLATIDTTIPIVDRLEFDSDRNSTVFHGKYSAPIGSWVILGLTLSDSVLDFTALDSIVFYAKGDGKLRVSLENWSGTLGDPNNLKAWTGDYLVSNTWQRLVIKPSDFLTVAEDPTTTGWESVRTKVMQFHIFDLLGTEIYLDDIWFYGVKF